MLAMSAPSASMGQSSALSSRLAVPKQLAAGEWQQGGLRWQAAPPAPQHTRWRLAQARSWRPHPAAIPELTRNWVPNLTKWFELFDRIHPAAPCVQA